jgi:hypothetical protein
MFKTIPFSAIGYDLVRIYFDFEWATVILVAGKAVFLVAVTGFVLSEFANHYYLASTQPFPKSRRQSLAGSTGSKTLH